MLRAIYNALWWIVAPTAVTRLYVRSRRERGYREHIAERFGRTRARRPDDDAPLIWVHAVSVGEKSWLKLMLPEVAVEQSGTPPPLTLMVWPAQKMSDSGIVPLSTICVEVLAATVPLSTGVPVASVEL